MTLVKNALENMRLKCIGRLQRYVEAAGNDVKFIT